MQFFLDTADVEKIRELNQTGLVNGVTTNPSLIAKSGRDFFETLREISSFIEWSNKCRGHCYYLSCND